MKLRYPEIKDATGIHDWGSPWGKVVSIEVGEDSPELTDQEGALMKRDFPFLKDVASSKEDEPVEIEVRGITGIPAELPKERSLLMKLCKELGIKTSFKMKNVEMALLINKLKEEKING